jgi:hypothetical protein
MVFVCCPCVAAAFPQKVSLALDLGTVYILVKYRHDCGGIRRLLQAALLRAGALWWQPRSAPSWPWFQVVVVFFTGRLDGGLPLRWWWLSFS